MQPRVVALPLALALLGAAVPRAGAQSPITVSPGEARGFSTIAGRCPTFSWGVVAGADSFELVVYRVAEAAVQAAEPELAATLPGAANSWTPGLERCLTAGERYAWSLRAVGEDGRSDWSSPRLFQVAAGPSEEELRQALAVVEAYLRGSTGAPGPEASAPASGASGAPSDKAVGPGVELVAGGGPASRLLAVPNERGIVSEVATTTGVTFGLHGISNSTGDGSGGVVGQSTAASGDTAGVIGQAASAAGAAGVFDNTVGGDILRGLVSGVQVFEVAGTGQVTATGFAGDGSGLTGVTAADADTLDGIDSTALLRKVEIDTEAELEALLADVTNVLTDTETAATAFALAADGTNCAAGQFAKGIDAAGNAQGCADQSDVHAVVNGNTRTGDRALASNTTGWDNTATGFLALYSNTDGSRNTASGRQALTSNTTGWYNTATGHITLMANTTGSNNTASGSLALYSNTDGSGNTATGSRALAGNMSGSQNTASGKLALRANTTGSSNTASGYDALHYNTTGWRNTALGSRAGWFATTGSDNIFLGYGALGVAGEANTIRIGGTTGTGVGQQNRTFVAGIDGTPLAGSVVVVTSSGQLGVASGATGDANTLDGLDSTALLQKVELDTEAELEALLADVTNVLTDDETAATASALAADGTNCAAGQFAKGIDAAGNAQGCGDQSDVHAFVSANTRTGHLALASNTTGAYNTASGDRALYANTTGFLNTATGAWALRANTGGFLNTASGYSALASNTTGYRNTATGSRTLYANTSGTYNTATGDRALSSNTTGARNTAAGHSALASNILGSRNTATGDRALTSNTYGSNNTASGSNALYANTYGSNNTASGFNALYSNTSGNYNTATGWRALDSNTTGSFNTATGRAALYDNTTGYQNTATGIEALLFNSTGFRNTASGVGALFSNTTGSRNTALGFFSGRFATTGNDNIFLGSGAFGVAGEANTIRIGGTTGTGAGQQNRTFIAGIRGVTTANAPAVAVLIDTAGQLGTISSSSRYKEEIRDMAGASERLLELRPVTFRYRREFDGGEKPLQFGLIAEEVAEVFPELVVYDADGRPETVMYHLLGTLLLNELQRQERRIEAQQLELERLRARLDGPEASWP